MKDLCTINRWEQLKKQFDNLTPEDFLAQMNDGVSIIDCRRPNEFASGHLLNAINMDYFGEEFYEQLESLDLQNTYLVCCRSGRRSIRTCTLMKNAGFERVFNLNGGLKEWMKQLGEEDLVK